MKRMIAVLLLMCMLCGCGSRNEPLEPAVLMDTAPTTQSASEEGLIHLQPSQPQEETQTPSIPSVPIGQNQAAYVIAECDNSIRNDSADVLVTIRYQQVLLDNAQPQWENINDLIREDYLAFLDEVAYLYETSPEEWEAMLQSMDILYGNLMANRNARVTNNSGSIFSIRIQQDWFMGGVFNSDAYGLNFDLTTGQALPLSRLSDLPEAEFEVQLKTIICEDLAEDMEFLFEDPAVKLGEYTLADFEFYLEEGELVLTFPTYTFGPGAMGATEVKTGLYPEL